MVRSGRILQIVDELRLIPGAIALGSQLLRGVELLCEKYPGLLTNPRGRGLLVAFTVPERTLRDLVVRRAREEEALLVLPCGVDGIRFRPSLAVTADEVDDALARLERVLAGIASATVAVVP
jgi:L-lysine 6-transaminase